ncbi:MAG TPA: hypothetical protein VJS30_01535 [Paraburkholderia sp.]|uniref:hypothetical protein n=1 Tax=Burkholderia pyrrocinia TaxID=60550 RepID=UPI002BA3A86C|nr:hypothetical protein [Paraburkholderia sp.]
MNSIFRQAMIGSIAALSMGITFSAHAIKGDDSHPVRQIQPTDASTTHKAKPAHHGQGKAASLRGGEPSCTGPRSFCDPHHGS